MYICEWHYSCRVTVTDWIGKDEDGETPIRIGIESFSPGSSVSKPDWEKVLYCPRREEQKIRNYLDSIVYNVLFRKAVKACI